MVEGKHSNLIIQFMEERMNNNEYSDLYDKKERNYDNSKN